VTGPAAVPIRTWDPRARQGVHLQHRFAEPDPTGGHIARPGLPFGLDFIAGVRR